jgi:hypothetical protein
MPANSRWDLIQRLKGLKTKAEISVFMLMFCWILKEEPRKILTAASDEARYSVRPFTAE